MTNVAEASNLQDDQLQTAMPELERLQLQNLYLQQLVCREQLNLLTLQFLQTAQPRALQERIEALTGQINAVGESVLAARNLDPRRYQLDVERGVFVERNPSK